MTPNPTVELVSAGARLAKRFEADVILGIGGGSSLDAAKAIAVEATHEGTSWDEKKRGQSTNLDRFARFVVVGVEAYEVEIEVHAGWGNADKIAVVGLPDAAVRESKDRVTTAICNSALRWPSGKQITINLAPADVRKEGPSFDLPIALGMLKLEESNRVPDLDCKTLRKPQWSRESMFTEQRHSLKWWNFSVVISPWSQSAPVLTGILPAMPTRNSTSARSKGSVM